MRACDEKLKSSLVEAMKLDNARLEEEMKHCEPHVFSEEFERNMEKMLTVHRRKSTLRTCLRYIAAAVLVLLLTGGILFIGSEDLRASEMSIDILEWLEEFFRVENGIDDRSDSDAIFDESRIGYMTEGFEKVSELITFASVQYEYRNDDNKYISVEVQNGRTLLQMDNEGIEKEVHLNVAGYEYTQIYKTEENDNSVMWIDKKELCYYITGTVEMTELVNIMNGISY